MAQDEPMVLVPPADTTAPPPAIDHPVQLVPTEPQAAAKPTPPVRKIPPVPAPRPEMAAAPPPAPPTAAAPQPLTADTAAPALPSRPDASTAPPTAAPIPSGPAALVPSAGPGVAGAATPPATATGGGEPDLAYGAFQRGLYISARNTALPRAQAGDTAAHLAAFDATRIDGEIAQLQTALDRGRGKLDPATVKVLETNLETIRKATEDARAALARDPANRELQDYFASTVQSKLDLMRRATAMAGV